MKLVHIILDEKFPDAAFDRFESVVPGQSTYILSKKKTVAIKHIRKIEPLTVVSLFAVWNPRFIKQILRHDVLILHSLTAFALELVAKVHGKIKIVWIGMGYDYYDLIYPDKGNLLEPKTRRFFEEHIKRARAGKHYLSRATKGFIRCLIYPNSSKKRKIVQKVDYFAPVLTSEYYDVERALGYLKPQLVDWNYGLSSRLVNEEFPSAPIGRNVLVGNSAAMTNNHFDIFDTLSKLDLPPETKIIVPLVYGDKFNVYADAVARYGLELFGKRFHPITEFMHFRDYVLMIASCHIVIMNQKRQQAGGNISAALRVGAKVFLNPENRFFDEFWEAGAYIYRTTGIESSDLACPLGSAKVATNREVIYKRRSVDAVDSKTGSLCDELREVIHAETATTT